MWKNKIVLERQVLRACAGTGPGGKRWRESGKNTDCCSCAWEFYCFFAAAVPGNYSGVYGNIAVWIQAETRIQAEQGTALESAAAQP
ncbi:MAG: hypothetical protein V8S93_04490 [Lachnospiraceae bacterium]